jgi:SWI/SNF-related matrix-associated actin-dependent regulator of chromatin subfamily A3
VGHIPRAVAGRLAALMDTRLITVEGRMIGQNIDRAMHYKLGLDLSIYARPSHREVLEPELVWATPGQKGFEAMRAGQAEGSSSQGSAKGKGKGKAKARGAGDTGLHGSGNSGVGLPGNDYNEEEMRRLLDGLKKVQEDEKQANGVMVCVSRHFRI